MRTYLRGKITLLFMTFGLLLAIPAVALADIITADSDTVTTAPGVQLTKDLGTVAAGATVTPNPTVDFYLNCNGSNHLNDGQTDNITFASKNIVRTGGGAFSGGNASATNSSVTAAAAWPDDGTNCNAAGNPAAVKGGSSTVTITAPTTPGTYTYTITYNNSVNPPDITGNPVATFTLTVPAQTQVTGSFTAANKVYDGTTAATIASRSLSGVAAGDDVSLSGGTATFADKNVGTGKTVTGTGFSLSGADASKYTLASSTLTTTANITAKPLTVDGVTANNKVYDGGTSATLNTSGASLNGVVSGDTVSLVTSGASGSFANKSVETGKTVTISGLSLSGAGASNYTLTQPTATADITPLGITGNFTADNKVYDGDNSATVLTRTLNGAISGDTVSLTGGTATFANKNVGDAKTVTLAGATLGGADAGNYSLTSVSTTTANITARDLTVEATGVNKEYDGTTAATVNLSSDKLSGDTGTLDYTSASFNDKNVGTGKPVSVTGISISGADAGNYNLTNTSESTTANITAKSVTGNFTAADKVYDGNDSATVTGRSLSGAISGDDVSLTGGTAKFNNELVGSGKTVTLTGASLTGADKDNYVLGSVNTTTASILAWTTKGFFAPVDMGGVYNTVKGGSTVPLKFELFSGATELTATTDVKSLQSQKVSCTSGAEDAIEELAATGGTSLRYDTTGGQFIYNWKTPSGAGTCYKVTVTAQDNTPISAYFKLK